MEWEGYESVGYDLAFDYTHDLGFFKVKFWNSRIAEINGSWFIWNFLEMNKKSIAKL